MTGPLGHGIWLRPAHGKLQATRQNRRFRVKVPADGIQSSLGNTEPGLANQKICCWHVSFSRWATDLLFQVRT